MSEEAIIEVEFEPKDVEMLEQQASQIHLSAEEFCALIVHRKLVNS